MHRPTFCTHPHSPTKSHKKSHTHQHPTFLKNIIFEGSRIDLEPRSGLQDLELFAGGAKYCWTPWSADETLSNLLRHSRITLIYGKRRNFVSKWRRADESLLELLFIACGFFFVNSNFVASFEMYFIFTCSEGRKARGRIIFTRDRKEW